MIALQQINTKIYKALLILKSSGLWDKDLVIGIKIFADFTFTFISIL